MELTVLGCSGSFNGPHGESCSGYLLRDGATAIWVDCGNGTFGQLQQHVAPEDLTAVVLSHGHPDHCVDIYGLHVLLRYGLELGNLPVYAPEGLEQSLAALVSDWGDTFDWHAVGDGDRTTIGGVDLRFSRTDHPPPTCALEATSSGGKRLVYTADTGPQWSVDAFTPGADLVVSEASYLHEHRRSAIHLSAHEAGAAAREAKAKRLILTHLWPFVDKDAVTLEGSEAYGDAVTLAAQGLVTTI